MTAMKTTKQDDSGWCRGNLSEENFELKTKGTSHSKIQEQSVSVLYMFPDDMLTAQTVAYLLLNTDNNG